MKELLEIHDIDKLLVNASLQQQNDFLKTVLKLKLNDEIYPKYIRIFSNNHSVLQTCKHEFNKENIKNIITVSLNKALENFNKKSTPMKSTKAISTKKPGAYSDSEAETQIVNLNDANVDVEPLVKKQKKSNTHPKNKEHITNLKRKSDETFIFYNREPTEKVDRDDVNIDMIIEIKEKREGILIWNNGNREVVVSQKYNRQLKSNKAKGLGLIEPVSLTLLDLSIEDLITKAKSGKFKRMNKKSLPVASTPAPTISSEEEFAPESAGNPVLEPEVRGDDFLLLPALCPQLTSDHSRDFLWSPGVFLPVRELSTGLQDNKLQHDHPEHESDNRPSKIPRIS